jgi:hypothetical protein
MRRQGPPATLFMTAEVGIMNTSSYCVYYVVDARRREAAVGVSDTSDLEVMQRVDCMIIERDLSRDDAFDRAAKYSRAAAWKSFTVRLIG